MSLIVSLVAPASYTQPETLERAAEVLRTFGVEVRFPSVLQAQTRYLAGDVEHRLRVLHQAYTDPETHAVWAVRGGYGCAHLATEIDWASLPPKPLIGYSDLTVLLTQCQRHGLPAIHGPVMKEAVKLVADDVDQREASRRDFTDLLRLVTNTSAVSGLRSDDAAPRSFALAPVNASPDLLAEGALVGGNLAVLASIAGTPLAFHAPRGAIVILEDVGEPYYRIERDLYQLVASGALDEAAAVCLGTFEGCEPYGDLTPGALFATWLSPRHIPLFTGLPVGHGRDNAPWRYGDTARIQAGRLYLSD